MPPPVKKGLYAGGWGAHPRNEAKGLADAMGSLLQAPRPETQIQKVRHTLEAVTSLQKTRNAEPAKPWTPLDHALRVTDLLLQGGGFSAIVLDMGSMTPEFSARVPLATWFRYRAAAERSQSSIILLTQRPCAKSSAGLVLRLCATGSLDDEVRVFTGMGFHVEVERQRFVSNVIPLRKGPQRETGVQWNSRSSWADRR